MPSPTVALAAGGALLPALAVVLGGAVYLNALGNPFVYDDFRTIVDNASIRDWRDPWVVFRAHAFRPVVNLSYALDYAVWGLNPVGFHLTSLLLHLGNVVLLFRLARHVTEDRGRLDGGGAVPTPGDAVAFTAAGLFAVHPMLTEAVGYASARAEVLGATFFVLGVLAVRRALVSLERRWLALAVVWLVLGVGSKEILVVLPLVTLAYDRLLLAPAATTKPARQRLWRVHLPLIVLAAAASGFRLGVFLWVEFPPPSVAPWQYALMEATVLWRYLVLLLAPVSQSLVHSVRVVESPVDPWALVAVAGLGALCAVTVGLRRRAPLLGLGVAWPLLVLAPSSSLVPLNEAMVEHRVYLASMGVWLALGAGAGRAVWILEAAGIRARIASRVLLAGVLVALALLTVSRNFVWADPVLLWRDAARKAPDVWLPHYALGDALRLGHRCAEAIPAYQWALRLAPRAPVVYTNLGACLMERGRLAEAAEVFGAAVRLEIDPVRAHHNLGVLALAAGDRERALHHFVEAVNRDAHHVPSRRQLAMLYESAFPNRREALRLCQEIRLIDPAAEDAAACVRRNQVHLDAR